MTEYTPMTREALLAKGTCCDNGCVRCPWRHPVVRPKAVTSLLTDAMLIAIADPEAKMTLYSHSTSLVPVVEIATQITIVYKTLQETC